MATAQTIIDRALRLLGQIGAGDDPTSDETADALIALNSMVESWRNEKLMVYVYADYTLTLANGDSSYTYGSGGDVNKARTVKIAAAYIEDNSVSYPVRLIDELEYAAIPDKTTTGDWPDRIYYQPAYPLGIIYVYPVPNATRTLHLVVRGVVDTFTTAATSVSLPPGYEEALAFNLALRLAPEYQTSASPDVIEFAKEAKANLKRTNHRSIKANTDLQFISNRWSANIETDQ